MSFFITSLCTLKIMVYVCFIFIGGSSSNVIGTKCMSAAWVGGLFQIDTVFFNHSPFNRAA